MMSKPVYFLRHSGTMMPSGVWLFSSSAATMRGRARAEPFSVWQMLGVAVILVCVFVANVSGGKES